MKTRFFLPAALAAALTMPGGVSAQVTDTTKKPSIPPVSAPPAPMSAAGPARVITDSAIVAMLQTSHNQEVAAAELAQNKAESNRVKRFAETLKTDHSKALQELQTYADRMSNGASPMGMPSGIRDTARGRMDSSRTGRDNSAMNGRRDSSSIVGSDTAAVRDSASSGRDMSAMAGRRDSSRMVQSDLPPGKDSVGVRHDSIMTGRDSTLAGRRDTSMAGRIVRDSAQPNRQSGVTAGVTGQQAYPSGTAKDPDLENLQSMSGQEFDRQFIRLQVDHHQEEINHLRNDIIPLIKDSGLKSLVQRQLPIMGAHLREAQAIDAYLKTVN